VVVLQTSVSPSVNHSQSELNLRVPGFPGCHAHVDDPHPIGSIGRSRRRSRACLIVSLGAAGPGWQGSVSAWIWLLRPSSPLHVWYAGGFVATATIRFSGFEPAGGSLQRAHFFRVPLRGDCWKRPVFGWKEGIG